jgi:hypothetical protein
MVHRRPRYSRPEKPTTQSGLKLYWPEQLKVPEQVPDDLSRSLTT